MDELFQLKEKVEEKKRLETQLEKSKNDVQKLKYKLDSLKEILKKELEDVQKLEGNGLTAMFYSFLGNKVEKLDKERQEYLSARLKYENAKNELEILENDILKLESQMHNLGIPETDYKNRLDKKSRKLKESRDETFLKYESLLETNFSRKKEINDAIEAGEMALKGLRYAIQSLRKAQGWGTVDMLGGGLITTAIKHSNIDEAKQLIHDVQVWLNKFRRELSDIQMEGSGELIIELDSFTTFADYFFDNLIFDWVVQSKINRSLEGCETVCNQVLDIVTQLRIADVEVTKKYKNTRTEFIGYIEKTSL